MFSYYVLETLEKLHTFEYMKYAGFNWYVENFQGQLSGAFVCKSHAESYCEMQEPTEYKIYKIEDTIEQLRSMVNE